MIKYSGIYESTTPPSSTKSLWVDGGVLKIYKNGNWEPVDDPKSKLTIDSSVKEGSTNPVSGGAVHTALMEKADSSKVEAVKDRLEALAIKTDKIGTLRDLYISAGAKYNEQTGYYELNGLTDITEEQMRVIYKYAGTPQVEAAFAYSKARTNLPMPGMYNGKLCDKMFFNCSALETVNLGYRQTPAALEENSIEVLGNTPFVGCRKLHTIYGTLFSQNPAFKWSHIFSDCDALKEVRIKKLQTSIPLSASPNLSKESVQYMITNANPPSGAAVGSITITLHPTSYARLKDDADIVAALEAKGGVITLVSA